jgi:hypothetical protein
VGAVVGVRDEERIAENCWYKGRCLEGFGGMKRIEMDQPGTNQDPDGRAGRDKTAATLPSKLREVLSTPEEKSNPSRERSIRQSTRAGDEEMRYTYRWSLSSRWRKCPSQTREYGKESSHLGGHKTAFKDCGRW